MKNRIFKLVVLVFMSMLCGLTMGATQDYQFMLKNKLSFQRNDETVVVSIPAEVGKHISTLTLVDDKDNPQAFQYLSQKFQIVFQATLLPGETKIYTLKQGIAVSAQAKTYAAQKLPANRNDIAWENDLTAYRMYSRTLLATEPNTANGVDMWSKKKSQPVIDKMYTYANYHSEQIEGVDAYSVNGKTLGAGGVVAYANNKLWLHDPYDECEIIANGPLYTEFVLKYNKVLIDGDFYVKTLRVVSVANGLLNKATVRFDGKNKIMKVASGIYLHTNMSSVTPAGVKFTTENNIIGYAENKSEGTVTSANARFYQGVYMPGATSTQEIDNHLVIMSDYAVGSDFSFYFGGGWNIFPVGRYSGDQDWFDALKQFRDAVQEPLYKNENILPEKSEVINAGIKVNSLWQAERAPSALDKLWYSGVYHAANMAFYSVYPKSSFLNYTRSWAVHNAWGIATHASADADSYAAGQPYLDLYMLDDVKDPTKINAIKTRVDSKLTDTQSAEWWWIDAMYMAMPVYARLGALTGDTKYYEKLYKLFKNTRDTLLVSSNTGLWTATFKSQYGNGPIIQNYGNAPDGLYSPEDGLWWRDWGFQPNVPPKRDPNNGNNSDTDTSSDNCAKFTPNGKKIFWGRGNGWAIGAMAHTLNFLPKDALYRNEYVKILQQMATALKIRQREDGFWNMSLDDPDHRPGGETSGTALITFAIAWGINNDVLDSVTYYPVVLNGWRALSTIAMQPGGVLTKIQGEGEAPINPASLMTSRSTDPKIAFGVGAFLCAAAEVAKLAPGEMPEMPPLTVGVENVSLTQPDKLTVVFTTDIDANQALNKENYLIENAPEIKTLEMSGTKSVIITFNGEIDYGRHIFTVQNIRGTDGSVLDADNSKIFIRTVPLTNIDYSVTVTAIGSQTGNPPTNTIDNSLATRWAQAGTGQWIRYDMGKLVEVTAVDIAYYLGNTRFSKFNIQTSIDGITYTTVLENQTTSGLTDELERYKFQNPVQARYVRIVCNGNSTGGENWNSITEVRVRFNILSGNKQIRKSDKLVCFPNPYKNGPLTLLNEAFSDNVRVEIMDYSGKILLSQNTNVVNGQAVITPAFYSPGLYLVRISDLSGSCNAKLSVE